MHVPASYKGHRLICNIDSFVQNIVFNCLVSLGKHQEIEGETVLGEETGSRGH